MTAVMPPRNARPTQPLADLVLRGWSWVRSNYLALLIGLTLLWVVAVPIVSVINFSFRDGTPAVPGGFTLDNYRHAYGNPQTIPALGNTIVYAAVVSLVSLALATLFAFLLERTDMPFRNAA
jgi:iron(III) transport system permease protein